VVVVGRTVVVVGRTVVGVGRTVVGIDSSTYSVVLGVSVVVTPLGESATVVAEAGVVGGTGGPEATSLDGSVVVVGYLPRGTVVGTLRRGCTVVVLAGPDDAVDGVAVDDVEAVDPVRAAGVLPGASDATSTVVGVPSSVTLSTSLGPATPVTSGSPPIVGGSETSTENESWFRPPHEHNASVRAAQTTPLARFM
jgi:hypothetical protein